MYGLVFAAILVLPPLTIALTKGLVWLLVLTGAGERLFGTDTRIEAQTDRMIRREQAKDLLYGFPEDEVEFSPSNCDI